MNTRMTAAAFRHFDRLQTNMAAAMMPKIAAATPMRPVTDYESVTFGSTLTAAPLTVKVFDAAKTQRVPFFSSPLMTMLEGGR